MSYESFIGLRYLMAKQRSRVLSIITLISISGVALGVTALIVVLSVMGGFKKDLTDKILGAKAHIVIQSPDYGVLDDATKIADDAMKFAGVIGASPFVESEVMISSPTNLSGVILRGVDIERVGQVSDLINEIIEGKLEYLRNDEAMLKEITQKRDRELDELLGRLSKERGELESEIARKRGELPGQNVASEAKGPESGQGFIPSMFGQTGEPAGSGDDDVAHDDVADGGEAQEEGSMPSLFDDEPADEAMPSLTGDGSVASSRVRLPGLIIGPELAKSLQVKLGDEVNVVTPRGEIGPMGPIPRSRPFRIVGVFYSGMYEYDANFAYTALEDAADFLDLKGATGVELKTVDVNISIGIAESIQRSMGPSVQVLDWQEMNQSLFFALKLEKIAMFVVLTFIILVASFSIVAMLIMIVIEKGREIAILKSMGASDAGIMRTFMFQGTLIGVVGAILGLLFGLGICYFLETVGFPLNSEVYYISTLPVDVNPVEIVLILVCTIVISVIATVYPSYQAARLRPVEGLRYD
ncbi:MAG: ABC transporter permease [Bradymonadaceae bacterium]|nr:ABC transporter permease [Lujinxingiaceae bacterium]